MDYAPDEVDSEGAELSPAPIPDEAHDVPLASHLEEVERDRLVGPVYRGATFGAAE